MVIKYEYYLGGQNMKRIFLALLVCALCGVAAYSEIKMEDQAWFDYKQTSSTNIPNNPVELGGKFQISRFYMTLQEDLGKDWFGNGIKARFTADLVKSTPVKLAYIDYAFLQAIGLKNEVVLSAGLIKSYFGNIADWAYPIPAKDATEVDGIYGGGKIFLSNSTTVSSGKTNITPVYNTALTVVPSSSADFGLMLSGKILSSDDNPNGYFKYYLEVLNGGGYSGYGVALNDDAVSNANSLALQVAGYVMPYNGVSAGVTYRIDGTGVAQQAGFATNTTTTNTKTSYDILVSANNLSFGDLKIPVDFLFQYIGENFNQSVIVPNKTAGVDSISNASWNGSVISVMLGYGFLDNTITPYVRYDIINQHDGDGWTNCGGQYAVQYSQLYLGFNLKPTANLQIKPYFSYIMAPGAVK